MTDQTATVAQPWFFRIRFYYGWVNLFMAAVAMVATLPGRSVGIGLITEPLLKDLSLSRVAFGEMTFWATLIGASFNLICGPAWANMFGRGHLGEIQGAAQVFTVFASASGPWFLASAFSRTGTYQTVFNGLVPAVFVLALVAWHIPVPRFREQS